MTISSIDLSATAPKAVATIPNKPEKSNQGDAPQSFSALFTAHTQKHESSKALPNTKATEVEIDANTVQAPEDVELQAENPEITPSTVSDSQEDLQELIPPEPNAETETQPPVAESPLWTLEDFFRVQAQNQTQAGIQTSTEQDSSESIVQQTSLTTPQEPSESSSTPQTTSEASQSQNVSIQGASAPTATPLPSAPAPENLEEHQTTQNPFITQLIDSAKELKQQVHSEPLFSQFTIPQNPELLASTHIPNSLQQFGSELSGNTNTDEFSLFQISQTHQDALSPGQTPINTNTGQESGLSFSNQLIQNPLLTYSNRAVQVETDIHSERLLMQNANPERSHLIERFQITEQLSRQIRVLKSGEARTLQMTLEPAHLGKLSLRLHQEQHNIHLQILTESPMTRELLESQLQHLKQQFNLQGLDLHQVSVDVHPGWSESQQQSEPDQTDSNQNIGPFSSEVEEHEIQTSTDLNTSPVTGDVNLQINYLA